MSSGAICLDLQPVSYDSAGNEESSVGFNPASRRLAGEQPRDYLLWSLFNLLFLSGYCFCCLSFSALVFSIKARDRKVIGDPETAATYGKTARCLNIAACVIGIGITVTCFLAIILSAENVLKLFREMRKEPQFLPPGQ
ncbi:interferon-induced transmembrane protein 5 isoform X1 [Protobothrops mucrosquamatus]|uniref:interferon-induced transmembrane protein 5 isoform X1 n=1 Tax=Protobothrops mucrosquamatus TaxID=103944 RepID=UPI000775F173|nr:interferon-induced transmembrane protein 5 isoform X1 [Protobothrops mucrosquamatus]